MLQKLQTRLIEKNVTLVAVSKMQPDAQILELYAQGQRIFAENRVQEMLKRRASLPADIEWHLIGHLQTNKVKLIVPFVGMIHSVDSLKLLQEIDMQAQKVGRVIDCLLQFYIAEEETKFGLEEAEAIALLESDVYRGMRHVRLCGVMGMASFSEHNAQIRKEFRALHGIFERLQKQYFKEAPYFKELSMGMSGDWEIAVEEGSTMVRIGSLLFPKKT